MPNNSEQKYRVSLDVMFENGSTGMYSFEANREDLDTISETIYNTYYQKDATGVLRVPTYVTELHTKFVLLNLSKTTHVEISMTKIVDEDGKVELNKGMIGFNG